MLGDVKTDGNLPHSVPPLKEGQTRTVCVCRPRPISVCCIQHLSSSLRVVNISHSASLELARVDGKVNANVSHAVALHRSRPQRSPDTRDSVC